MQQERRVSTGVARRRRRMTVVRASGALWALAAGALAGCADELASPTDVEVLASEQGESSARAPASIQCHPNNGGITLPPGFCAVVVADSVGRARHMAVTPAGDLYVALNNSRDGSVRGAVLALRDVNGDGRADERVRFGDDGGNGIAWRDGQLYYAPNDRVVRWTLPSGQLAPTGAPTVIVGGLPNTGDHVSKTIVLADAGTMFVNIGSASNACQVANRQRESPGVDPCPELPVRAGVWVFDPRRSNQTQRDGTRYATGLRNMVALAMHPARNELYGVQHGRDMLFENWPALFDVNDDAELPSEEFFRIERGQDYGWPYCYHDPFQNRKVLAPEYGGDGRARGRCTSVREPIMSFPAHWAPNGLLFYTGRQFPAKYRGGAFVAFHGGFDRAPLPNEGYRVSFVPFGSGPNPRGAAETFADGFAGSEGPLPANAKHRPVGLAQGPDGSLYISDDDGGRIWRVVYRGP